LTDPARSAAADAHRQTSSRRNRLSPISRADLLGDVMDTKEILLGEDDLEIVDPIRVTLERSGEFRIRAAPTVDDLLSRLAAAVPDALLLDTTLPGLPAHEVCRMIRSRERTAHLACIVLGQPTRGLSMIDALSSGADDYVSKPVDVGELEARLRAVLRRRAPGRSVAIRYQGARIDADFTAVRVSVDGKRITLTRRELLLLRALVEQPGSILSRKFLVHSVWTDGVWDPRVVDSAIWKLRRKLGEAGSQIETINGFGYRFNEPGADD
jgi:two-component system, OmpR family, phosphate regulon response regulator PhoB